MEVHYSYFKRDLPLYFEYPHIRANGEVITPGQAAQICASLRDDAEKLLETGLGNKAPLPLEVMFNSYINLLDGMLRPLGGRVTREPHYPGIPVNPLKKGFTNGGCL